MAIIGGDYGQTWILIDESAIPYIPTEEDHRQLEQAIKEHEKTTKEIDRIKAERYKSLNRKTD